MSEGAVRPAWTFLTNHGHVLVCIAEDDGIRGLDIAARVGRRNQYEIHPDVPLRHPIEGGHSVGELLVSLARLPVARPSGVTFIN